MWGCEHFKWESRIQVRFVRVFRCTHMLRSLKVTSEDDSETHRPVNDFDLFIYSLFIDAFEGAVP